MRTATFTIESISPYSASRPIQPELLHDKETPDEVDKRTWRQRAYATDKGEVYIPGIQFKFAIADAAKRLSLKIPGKNQQTYTKNVLAGVICPDHVFLGVKVSELDEEIIYAHVNGKRMPGPRVFRRYPIVHKWQSELICHVIDDELPKEVIERCVKEAGNLLGVGRFRPANGGYLGRFRINRVKWQ